MSAKVRTPGATPIIIHTKFEASAPWIVVRNSEIPSSRDQCFLITSTPEVNANLLQERLNNGIGHLRDIPKNLFIVGGGKLPTPFA